MEHPESFAETVGTFVIGALIIGAGLAIYGRKDLKCRWMARTLFPKLDEIVLSRAARKNVYVEAKAQWNIRKGKPFEYWRRYEFSHLAITVVLQDSGKVETTIILYPAGEKGRGQEFYYDHDIPEAFKTDVEYLVTKESEWSK